MQYDTLAQVERLLKEKKFNIDIEKFVQFLRIVKDNWIYPDAVQRYTKNTIMEVYEVLECLADKGYLEQALVVYCPNCNKFIGNYYKTIHDRYMINLRLQCTPEKSDISLADGHSPYHRQRK